MELAFKAIDYFGHNPELVVIALFGLLLLFMPIAEELVLLLGGFLAAQNPGSWPATLLCALAGVVVTDVWTFWLAKTFGGRFMRIPLIKPFTQKLDKARDIVSRHGMKIVFFVRFIPGGIRPATFIACGLSGMNTIRFALLSLAGGIISIQMAFWIGFSLGDNMPALEKIARRFETTGKIIFAVVLIVALVYLARRIIKARQVRI